MANIPVNANSAIINTTEDAQFIQLANRSIAEIIDSGNNVRVYQSKDNVYVEAVQVNPTQQFISQTQVNSPGGNQYQVQFNLDGEFAGSNSFTYDPMGPYSLDIGGLRVSNVSNLNIGGGNAGYYLQTDGTGNLRWAVGGEAGNGLPGGNSNTFQFNDNGFFNGIDAFSVNANANSLVFGNNLTITGNVNPLTDTANTNVSIYSLGSPTNRWKDIYLSNNSLYLGNTKISTDGSNSINTADMFINDVRLARLSVTSTPSDSKIIIGGDTLGSNAAPIIQIGGNANAVLQIGSDAANGQITVGNANIGGSNVTGLILPTVVGGNFTNVTISNANVSRIINGNSNVNIANADANVTIGVNGTPNIVVVTNTGGSTNNAPGVNVSGYITTSNSITAPSFIGILGNSSSNVTIFGNGTSNGVGPVTISSGGSQNVIFVSNTYTTIGYGAGNSGVNVSGNISNVIITSGNSDPNTNSTLTVSNLANIGTIANTFTSNNYTLGDATTTISTTRWLSYASGSAAMQVTLYQTPTTNVSSLDFHITATAGMNRQVTKLLAVYMGGMVSYIDYGTMWVGTQVADYQVDYSSSNIRLLATPTMADTQYRIVMTTYNN